MENIMGKWEQRLYNSCKKPRKEKLKLEEARNSSLWEPF
jgi:hypothetical protein